MAGAGIQRLAIDWNSLFGERDKPGVQPAAFRAEFRSAGIGVAPDITFRDGQKWHFYDHIATSRSLDDSVKPNMRWDETARKDNLMFRSKECSVFVEES